MDDLTLINNTSVYRNPAAQSPLQGQNVMQPAAVYSKIMLRTIELTEADYTFDSLAVERTMPSNNGSNEIVFKRFLSLAAHTQPLVEGIPPASDQGRMTAIKATTNSYGRVMKFTDKVNWAVVDPLISEYTRQLSMKIPETKDLLAQEALLAECQMFYACEKEPSTHDDDAFKPIAGGGTVTHITMLTPDCTPTIDEFRKIVLSMEAAKVRPYSGSNFLVLASSAVLFDLITDKRVKEFMSYEQTGRAYSTDMVIDLFNLAFKKAKTIKTDNTFVGADGAVKYLYHFPAVSLTAAGSGTASPAWFNGASNYAGAINVASDIPLEEGGTTSSAVATVYYVSRDSSTHAYVLGTPTTTTVGAILTWLASATSVTYDKLNVHYSFVLGEECLFRVGVEGHTAPQFIKKELGSAGTEDPLNQRQSIGWKIDSIGYKVPNPDAVVAYVSCPSQYKVNINARPDLRNQFTDYQYGYRDASTGAYYHPEQVLQTVVSGAVKYFVRGTNIEVVPTTMTSLVKPVNGGRIDANGQKMVYKGTLPTEEFALASNHATRFMADQVVEHTDGKFYIKGLAGTASAEVLRLPQTWSSTEIKADGTGYETRTAIDEGVSPANKTGDPRID